jgi:SAM-dependent methyltransferase
VTLIFDLPENAFGQRKRLHVVAEILRARAVKSVLDVGCGSGQLLTLPLSLNFPEVAITGLDEDKVSISWARSHAPPSNSRFLLPEELHTDAKFDLVIASEVIEHVEDPAGFLVWLGTRLNPGGAVFLTLPNGFGPYEIIVFLYQMFERIGLRHRATASGGGELADTFAASPHINFFSFLAIRRIIAQAGFAIERYQPRTFLCGGVFDGLVGNRLEWNARISEALPPLLASDWMFLLIPRLEPSPQPFRRGPLARLRRRFNEAAMAQR